MKWISVKEKIPEAYKEVLIWIEDARGPCWRNNHAIVAYYSKGWWTQLGRRPSPVSHSVLAWSEFEEPETGLFQD